MLTPEEIQSREFLVSLRGYDRDEVDAFLDEVAEAFAQLRAQAGVAPAPTEPAAAPTPEPAPAAPEPVAAPAPAPAEPAVSPFASIAAETQRILEAAQEAGDAIRRQAEAEVEEARRSALADADSEVQRLREQAAATQAQIDVLLQRRQELGERLRQARETVELALVEIEDEAEPEPVDATTSVLAEAAADGPVQASLVEQDEDEVEAAEDAAADGDATGDRTGGAAGGAGRRKG